MRRTRFSSMLRALALGAVLLLPGTAQSQEPRLTDRLLREVAARTADNDRALADLRGGLPTLDDALAAIGRYPDRFDVVGLDELRAVAEEARARRAADVETIVLTFLLEEDAVRKVEDAEGRIGILLTGEWIRDYAKLIELKPVYDRTIANYREQVALQGQAIAGLEGVISIKDEEIAILEEIRAVSDERGDLYKAIADARGPTFFENLLGKLAFPGGVALGLIVGTSIN